MWQVSIARFSGEHRLQDRVPGLEAQSMERKPRELVWGSCWDGQVSCAKGYNLLSIIICHYWKRVWIGSAWIPNSRETPRCTHCTGGPRHYLLPYPVLRNKQDHQSLWDRNMKDLGNSLKASHIHRARRLQRGAHSKKTGLPKTGLKWACYLGSTLE